MGISAGIWVVLTHEILRMAGIAEDEESCQLTQPLSFVSSVARRDPTPPEPERPSRLSRVDATAKGKLPFPLHRPHPPTAGKSN